MTDPFDYLATLPPLENYSAKDRYHDFRTIFSTDEGKRALRYILERGCVFIESKLISPVDPYKIVADRGKRQLALEILAFVYNEPTEKPDKQTR